MIYSFDTTNTTLNTKNLYRGNTSRMDMSRRREAEVTVRRRKRSVGFTRNLSMTLRQFAESAFGEYDKKDGLGSDGRTLINGRELGLREGGKGWSLRTGRGQKTPEVRI